MNYFAYALDMDRDDIVRFCTAKNFPIPPLMNETPAYLPGHRLVFNAFSAKRMAGTANVMATGKDTDRVWGALYELPEPFLKILDLREGASGAYERYPVKVTPQDGKYEREAVTYRLAPGREIDKHVPPAFAYMALILKNARRLGFPAEYVRELGAIKTT